MIAALTLLSLLAVSLTVIRLGGTALRLTGMSQQAARFQAISALTGTGFTTSEAETTMHHPVRRKILIMLMFTGHLGIVSMASTVILGVSAADDGTLLQTLFFMVLAVLFVCALALSPRLDNVMCAFVARLLHWSGWFDQPPYLIMSELPSGEQFAEHEVPDGHEHSVTEMIQTIPDLQLLKVNETQASDATGALKVGDRLLCFGTETQQRQFSDLLRS